MAIKGRHASKTDIGLVRQSNEDKAISMIDAEGNTLLCVCDGMGGYMKGDFASKIAVDIVTAAFTSKLKFFCSLQVKWWIGKVVKNINYSVYSESHDTEKFKGMGTTFCMALLYKNKIFVANVGDSRAYVVDEEKITQLTQDQSLVQSLANRGEISEDEKKTSKYRHYISNYIGLNKNINYSLKVYNNEKKQILLCSDGLYNNASEKQIFSAVNTGERLDQKISTLIGIAKANGGTDNIAVSMWEPFKHD